MNTGLLFYLAHRTSLCQRLITRYAGYFDLTFPGIKICAKQAGLRPSMANLIARYPVVFVVGAATESARPECARLIFDTLKIPLDSHGEPKGVLRLNGNKVTGYLIESMNQAIAVLPDIPEELELMLPLTCKRLQQKFDLSGEPPAIQDIDYKMLVTESMEHSKAE